MERRRWRKPMILGCVALGLSGLLMAADPSKPNQDDIVRRKTMISQFGESPSKPTKGDSKPIIPIHRGKADQKQAATSAPTAVGATTKPASAPWLGGIASSRSTGTVGVLPKEVAISPSVVQGARAFGLTYTGGIKGYIEPCGCQAGMLGGVARLGGLMMGLKARGIGALGLDAGSLFFEGLEIEAAKQTQARLKAGLLADTMRDIGTKAMGIGPYDLALGRATLDGLLARSGMRAVASNLVRVQDGQAAFLPRLLLEVEGVKVGIVALTGEPISKPDQAVVWPKDYWARHGLRLIEPLPAVKQQAASLRREGARWVILLSTLGRAKAESIAETTQEIDLVIDGEEGEGIASPLALRGGNALLMLTEKDGQKAGALAIYDPLKRDGVWITLQTPEGRKQEIANLQQQIQGYLRQAEQMNRQGPDFAPIAAVYTQQAETTKLQIKALEKAMQDPPALPNKGRPYLHQLYALSERITDLPRTLERIKAYEAAVKKANFEAMANVKPIPFTKDGDFFVGAETCRACHAPAYDFWKTTRHAGAYHTLEKKQKQFDMDCIGCHTVGWQKPGGLFDLRQPKHLAHVQCESCHSYGGLHVRTAASKKNNIQRKVPASVCTQCHQGHHHPGFHYENSLKGVLGKGHGEALLKRLLSQGKK